MSAIDINNTYRYHLFAAEQITLRLNPSTTLEVKNCRTNETRRVAIRHLHMEIRSNTDYRIVNIDYYSPIVGRYTPMLEVEQLQMNNQNDFPKIATCFKASGTDFDWKTVYCPVCLNSYGGSTFPSVFEKCGHVFCSNCIAHIMSSSRKLCPKCRVLSGAKVLFF
jgi:hypothetical protein